MRFCLRKFLVVIIILLQSICNYGQEHTNLIYHSVKADENVYRISLLYKVSMDSIQKWNSLDEYNTIKIGQVLKIKGRVIQGVTERVGIDKQYHVVSSKENVYRISLQYNVKMDSIKVWNNLDENYTIEEGQTLIVTYGAKKSIGFILDSSVHIVAKKENIYRLSLKYNVLPESLRQWNNLDDYYTIQVGQRLIISRIKKQKLVSKDTNSKNIPDTTKKEFLPIYSDNVIKKRSYPFKEIVLFYYKKSNFLYKIILGLNLFFIVSSFILALVVTSRRVRGWIRNMRVKKRREEYREFIAEWIYDESEKKFIPRAILSELRRKVYRDAFLEELLSLHSNFVGESADKLVQLFKKADLKKYSIKKLDSWFWHVKAKGMRELAQMNVIDGNHLIYKYLNASNSVLRLEAQLAWIQLNSENPDGFYDYPNVQITEWGQLCSLDTFKKLESVPNFKKWLQKSNKSVTIFALRMTGIFKQFESADLVSELLYDSDDDIRREAIKALGIMAMPTSIEELFNLFPKADLIHKREIITALNMISDSINLSFFRDVIINETDLNLRLLAARGLAQLGYEGIEILDAMFNDADQELHNIINHAKSEDI